MHINSLGRGGAVLALTAALVLAVPLAASAHVRVYPKQADAGADDTLLTISVPNESATADTTEVVIGLPTATPFGDVSYQPVAGWTGRVVTTTLPKPAKIEGTTVTTAPTSMVFTAAAGTKLSSGQFQDFVLTVGPMPDTGRIELPTTQTYSDGTVVRWDQSTPTNGAEPDHPAPTIYITDTPPTDDAAPGTATVTAAAASDGTVATIATVIGGTALVVGILALIVALLAVTRSSSRRRR